MAKKVVDISDKLSFDENPKMKIMDLEVEINAEAETMLKIMGEFANKGELNASLGALELLFGEEDREKILALEHKGKKLSSRSLMTIIQEAMTLTMGADEGE